MLATLPFEACVVGPFVASIAAKWISGVHYTVRDRWRSGILGGTVFAVPFAIVMAQHARHSPAGAFVTALVLGGLWGALQALGAIGIACIPRGPLSGINWFLRTFVGPPVVGSLAGPIRAIIIMALMDSTDERPLAFLLYMAAGLFLYVRATLRRIETQDEPVWVGFKVALIGESIGMLLWGLFAVLMPSPTF